MSPPVTSITFSAAATPAVLSMPMLGAAEPSLISLSLAAPPLGLCSLPIAPWQVSVNSYQFSPGIGPNAFLQPAAAKSAFRLPPSAFRPHSTTRLSPPRDIVKLEDRLQYPIAAVVGNIDRATVASLSAAAVSISIARRGISVSALAAVLADEMGLGKTMQAITAMRMLLHAGEIASVLLVCPKPLVTNWQREFATWAPELPIAVIEGDPERRALAMATGRRAGENCQLRTAVPRCANCLADVKIALRSGHARRSPAHQKPQRHHQPGRALAFRRNRSWALTGTPVENSVDDLIGIFEFVAPGHLSANMKPRAVGRAVARLCAAPHEGRRAGRFAAQGVPRRGNRR